MLSLWTFYLLFPAIAFSSSGLFVHQIPLSNVVSKDPHKFATTSGSLITPTLDSYIRSTLSLWGSPGLSVAIVRKNSSSTSPDHPGWDVSYGSYGVANSQGNPMTPDTLFSIASNSKLFLSSSVGLLIHNKTLERNLSWHSKVRDLIPQWELMDKVASEDTRIFDMLIHRTGLPNHDLVGRKLENGVFDLVASLRNLPPSAPFRYTNQYESLTLLPPVLLNVSYESFIEENIFTPLSMSSSTYSVEKAEASGQLAHGFLRSLRSLRYDSNGTLSPMVPFFQRPGEEDNWAGAGGVISSARDLTAWIAMLMSDGNHPWDKEKGRILPEGLLQRISKGEIVGSGQTAQEETSVMTYGFVHGGSVPGFRTQIARFPYDNLGIIILSNDEEFGVNIMQSLMWRIAEELIPLDKIVNWHERDLEALRAQIKKARSKILRPDNPEPPSVDFLSMEGDFVHPAYPSLSTCYLQSTSSSSHCAALLSSPAIKPYLDLTNASSVPTLISSFKGFFTTHMILTHFSGNLFNASMIWTNHDVRVEEKLEDIAENVTLEYKVALAEWVSGGWGMKGDFWGSGWDVDKSNADGMEGVEVWFEPVN